jgi:hypothetical protein
VVPLTWSAPANAMATAFAPITNAGGSTATDCRIAPATGVPSARLLFPHTNSTDRSVGRPDERARKSRMRRSAVTEPRRQKFSCESARRARGGNREDRRSGREHRQRACAEHSVTVEPRRIRDRRRRQSSARTRPDRHRVCTHGARSRMPRSSSGRVAVCDSMSLANKSVRAWKAVWHDRRCYGRSRADAVGIRGARGSQRPRVERSLRPGCDEGRGPEQVTRTTRNQSCPCAKGVPCRRYRARRVGQCRDELFAGWPRR